MCAGAVAGGGTDEGEQHHQQDGDGLGPAEALAQCVTAEHAPRDDRRHDNDRRGRDDDAGAIDGVIDAQNQVFHESPPVAPRRHGPPRCDCTRITF